MASDDWRADQRNGELFDILDHLWPIEEIEIARIRDLCDAHGISCERFVEVWRELCDEAHIIINQAEERIY